MSPERPAAWSEDRRKITATPEGAPERWIAHRRVHVRVCDLWPVTCQVVLRRLVSVRRLLQVKGDVTCTLLLLLLLCLLLYIRQVSCRLRSRRLSRARATDAGPPAQVVLSAGWDAPAWRLQLHSSTSSSRTLLGTGGGKGEIMEVSVCPSVCPSVCLSVHLSIRPH